jgi:transposase
VFPGSADVLPVVVSAVVDPAARPFRRSFTAAYRAQVLAEYEAAPRGQKAAVLRREGLYQSQIAKWAVARDGLKRGARLPRRAHRAVTDDVARLRVENQRLSRELATSQAVVEIMGKLQGYAGDRCQGLVLSSRVSSCR